MLEPTQIIITAAKSLASFWVPKGEMTFAPQQPKHHKLSEDLLTYLLVRQLEVLAHIKIPKLHRRDLPAPDADGHS